MIDVSQWRASIGLWNYCQAASSRPANGRYTHSFKAPVDSKSGSTTSGEKTSKLPAALSLIALLLLLFLSLSLLRHILMIPPTGNCYQVQCTTGVTVTDTNYLQSVVLPGGSSYNLIYNDLYLIVCLRMLLLLSGDVELNPGPITDKELNMAAIMKIFDSSAHHYMTIGIGLGVKTVDLIEVQDNPNTKLHLVFQRWFDADRDVNWDTLIKLCDDYPDKLGKAQSSLLPYRNPNMAAVMKIFVSSAHHYKLIGEGLGVKTTDLEPRPGAEIGFLITIFQRWFKANKDVNWDTLIKLCDEFPHKLGKANFNLLAHIGKDDQKPDSPPDVSKYCPELKDNDKKFWETNSIVLTEEEEAFIKKVSYILVTATDIEYHAVMGATDPSRRDGKYIRVWNEDESSKFILAKFGLCHVAIIMTGQGPYQTREVLTSVQKTVKAKYVIAIGICYGVKVENKTKDLGDKTNLGDIIVAESIINTQHQRMKGTTIVLPDTYKCGDNLLNLFKHDEVFEFDSKPVKVHVGALASEFTLQRNQEEKQKRLECTPQALGGEMEASGIIQVARREKFEWIVIKAIVDWGDEKKNKKWQTFGAVSCTRFVLQCLKDQPGEGHPTNYEEKIVYVEDLEKSDPPPVVSKYCPELEDIEQNKIKKKKFRDLTEEEKEFIKKVRYILVTATPIEYRAVMGTTEPTGHDGKYIQVVTKDESAHFILGKYGPCNVAITRTGQGPDETEDILTSVQKTVRAKYVIAIGICYGAKESKTDELDDKTNLGDIIVAKSIINTEQQRIEGRDTIILSDTYPCGTNLLEMFKHYKVFEFEGKAVKVHHQGSLASEFTLFRSKEAKEEKLKYVKRALGGEMEAKGIYKAAKREGFEWIVIKAIVDWGTEEKDKMWQPFGAVSCAKFVLKCLNDMGNPTNYGTLEQWCEEGTMTLTLTRVLMIGPAGSGKTCAQRLLLNEDPPNTTDSTPIACKAVKALRIACVDGSETWKRITRDELLKKLASSLKKAASQPSQQIDSRSTQRTIDPEETQDLGDILKEITDLLPNAEAQLSEKWVYIVESGGQPAYQELLPLFTRAATLNVITLDISKDIDEEFEFMYRINGREFPRDGGMKYTNRKIFNSVVSSASVQKPIDIPFVKPQSKHSAMSFVLGTHYDVLIERSNEKDAETKVAEMSSNLMSEVPHLENRIISKIHRKSVIYPVDTMQQDSVKREKTSREILQIMLKFTEATIEIKVPIRCFVFELYLENLGKKAKGNGFVTKKEVIKDCKKDLYMNEVDVEIALTFLHNSTIILYYPHIKPQLVFINPKKIIDVLSHLLALTYVDYPTAQSLATNISQDEITRLKNKGCFNKALLDKFYIFSDPFTPTYFINLLEHLHIIKSQAQIEDNCYFLPSALPAYNNNYDKDLPESIKPLYYVWKEEGESKSKNFVLVPQGIFPLIYVHLLEEREYKVRFAPHLLYRDAVSLWIYTKGKRYTIYIINRYEHIEVYFDGPQKYSPKNYCQKIRELINTAINKSSDAINVKYNYANAFPCPNGRVCCYCIVDEKNKVASCTGKLCDSNKIEKSDKTYWGWFKDEDVLDVQDTSDVQNLLSKSGGFITNEWFNLGLSLGLYHKTLKEIDNNYKGDTNGCVRECLVKWLEKADVVNKKGGAKWSTLIKALEVCDENSIADYIKKELEIQDKIESDDQNTPDVSKHCLILEDIEKKSETKFFTQLTREEKESLENFMKEVHVILVTATPIEYCAVMGATEPIEYSAVMSATKDVTEPQADSDGKYIKVITEDQSAHFILGKFGPCNVAIIRTGQGPDKTDEVLTSVQKTVRAKYVIAIGICYGAKESKTDKTNLTDIIVAKRIINTEHQCMDKSRKVLPKTYQCGDKLLNLFKHEEVFKFERKSVKVHTGDLASEFTLQRNEGETQTTLNQVSHVLGGEMEANGINRVARREKFEWIVIKAIVDWGDEDKNKDWQKFAAVSCARFVRQCLEDNKQPGEGDPLKNLAF